MMREILNHLFEHKTLDRNEAERVLVNIAGGRYSEPEIAAFLTIYLMRSITVDELKGFRDALLNLCIRVDLGGIRTLDLCGTGGDGKDTFNISTLSAFVVAGAGAKVAKHGNYGVTSTCGSSNIFEYFGYRFSTDQGKLQKELEEAGICFLHAPLFNPAMKNIVPVRKALKVKTFFNMLGPMVNPSFPSSQLIGVYNSELARIYNYIYQQSDCSYSIVHSLDGYDEISLTSGFKYIYNGIDEIVYPEQMGFTTKDKSALAGGRDEKESAGIFLDILKGRGSRDQNDIVVANSLVALRCYFPEKTIDQCHAEAEESLSSGRAFQSFNKLMSSQS